jgi:hypothetical protein
VVLIAALLVVGLVCAIAAWFVIREAARLSVDPPPPVFDVDEALDWVIENLPDDIAATLTPADARRILEFQLEYFEVAGVVGDGSESLPPGDVMVGGAETVEYIRRRAGETGEGYLLEQVQGVLDTQLDYLRAIGAVGPPAPGNGSETGSGGG